jgi:hypothetical protein
MRLSPKLLAPWALALPFVVAPAFGQALVESATRPIVRTLLLVTRPLVASPAKAADAQAQLDADADAAVVEEPGDLPGMLAAGKGGPLRLRPAPQPASIFVSQSTVLRLAQTTARPQGSFVGAAAGHPAGLRLTGVAALGIGVQDGDILVEALGVTPHSPGQVIGAIIQARAQHLRFLSGKLWRHGKTFSITVEQPYLEAPSTSAEPAPSELPARKG